MQPEPEPSLPEPEPSPEPDPEPLPSWPPSVPLSPLPEELPPPSPECSRSRVGCRVAGSEPLSPSREPRLDEEPSPRDPCRDSSWPVRTRFLTKTRLTGSLRGGGGAEKTTRAAGRFGAFAAIATGADLAGW